MERVSSEDIVVDIVIDMVMKVWWGGERESGMDELVGVLRFTKGSLSMM